MTHWRRDALLCWVFLLSHQVKRLANLLDLYQQLCQLRIWLWSLNSLEAIAVLGIVFCLSEPRLTAFCFSFFARWSWTESSHGKFKLSGIIQVASLLQPSANKAPGHGHSAAGRLQKSNSPWIWRGALLGPYYVALPPTFGPPSPYCFGAFFSSISSPEERGGI